MSFYSLLLWLRRYEGILIENRRFLKGVSQFQQNFHEVGNVPREPFLHEARRGHNYKLYLPACK